ncbi:PTS transporter subunit EIIB [Motilimonas cestriensis]|uniref:PTS transporter subunit EIIB n=1 Tax=Motilimonas cestriensis TaxID=2742685 RepID=A0ABS8WDN1_9GAMM|nr:PTS transporter subunit EIIB [Motilimonas cestriensis]MCE2596370.1 PTS transporter subunit EIIB [Motilimonas cestriensis]
MIKQLATETIALLGGSDNITEIDHCITRVRIKVADYAKVDFPQLSKEYDSAVKGVVEGSVHLVVNQYKHDFTTGDIATELKALKG